MLSVSSVHDVSELITVPLCAYLSPVHSVVHCMCMFRSTVNQWLKVAGEVYRVSREGNKWDRGFSFAPSLPSCLLYSDGCSQSDREEAALVG